MSAPVRLRESYKTLALYESAGSPQSVDLSDNTNLWGAPPSALRVLREFPADSLARYPFSYSPELNNAFAEYVGVDGQCVVTGCGSDDILDSAIRAFVEPAGIVAMCDPTFSMIPVFTILNGATPLRIPFLSSFEPDIDALLKSGASLIYLCSPNNPTGTSISAVAIERFVREFPGVVILDEAYSEFSGKSYASLAASAKNLVVTRTFSKAFGLAGVRVGCAVSSPPLAREIAKSRGPYKIGALSEATALAALRTDTAWVANCVASVTEARAALTDALRTRGLSPLESQANFVMIPVSDAEAISRKLSARGITVRAFSGLTGIGDALRITVGPPEMMSAFIAALDEVLA